MASLSIFKTKERSGVLLNLTDHCVQIARVSQVDERPMVIDELTELPAGDDEAVGRWIHEKLPTTKGSGLLPGYVGFYPPERVLVRESVNTRNLADENHLRGMVSEIAKLTPASDWHAGALNPVDGTQLTVESTSRAALVAGVTWKSVRDLQHRLKRWGIRPRRLEIGTVATLGGLGRQLAHSAYPHAAAVCEISQTQTRIYLVGKDGVHTPPALPHGLLSIEEAAMKELGAPDVATAKKQLMDPPEALRTHSRRLVRMLSRHLRPAVDYFEMQTGQRIGGIFCAHLPRPLNWLEEALAAGVDLDFIVPDYDTWLPAVGLQLPEGGPPDRSWFQLLCLAAHLSTVNSVNTAPAPAAVPAAATPANEQKA